MVVEWLSVNGWATKVCENASTFLAFKIFISEVDFHYYCLFVVAVDFFFSAFCGIITKVIARGESSSQVFFFLLLALQ